MAMPTTGPENTVALWGGDVKGEAQKPRGPERQGLWEGVGVCNWPGQGRAPPLAEPGGLTSPAGHCRGANEAAGGPGASGGSCLT